MRVKLFAGLALVAMVSLTAACGSSSSAKGTNSTGGSGGTNGLSGSTIVIGNVGAYTGAQASSFAGADKALQAWADYVNAHGGIQGHPVKLIVKDLGNNLTGGLSAVKELVQSDHAVAILGEQDPGDTTWAKYVESTGVPVVGGEGVDLPFVQNPDFFAGGSNIFTLLYGGQKLAATNGSKFGVLYCAESPQCAGAVPINKAIAKATGVKIAVSAKISATAPNYTAVCQQLKSAGVQSYTIGDGSAIVLRVADECKADGLKAKMVTSDGTVTVDWLKHSSVNGMRAAEDDAPWFDTSTPATKLFNQIMSSANVKPSPIVMQVYVAGRLLQKATAAIPKGAAITPDSIKAGLYTLKNETLDGLAPPLTFVKGKPAMVNCYFVVGQENNKFTAPQGLKTSCAPNALVSGIVNSLPAE